MAQKFYTRLTEIGQAKYANAKGVGEQVEFVQMVVGDANGQALTPEQVQQQETMINQRRAGPINQVYKDEQNPNWLVMEQVLPPEVGGWTIHEIGIRDADGDLVAYGNYPATYKPVLEEGSSRTSTVRFVLMVSDTSVVTLKVDPSVVLATRKYADDAIAAHEQSRNHPAATTTELGFVEKATVTEAKSGAANKFPDAAGMKAAIAAASYQFANYDPERVYETGETCRGSDGHFYEFYDRDLAGTVQGVDPTDPLNRPHIWMAWDGVKPGTTIAWRSEYLPEGYLPNDGWQSALRHDYRRIFAAFGTTWGEGDGSTTFGMPGDENEFLRGWDPNGSRGLAEHQSDAIRNIIGDAPGMHNNFNLEAQGSGAIELLNHKTTNVDQLTGTTGDNQVTLSLDASRVVPTADENRPRNNAVIWLTKI